MDGIGQHSRAVSHDARKKLEEQQQEVDDAADDSHFIDFFLAFGCLFVAIFHNLLPLYI